MSSTATDLNSTAEPSVPAKSLAAIMRQPARLLRDTCLWAAPAAAASLVAWYVAWLDGGTAAALIGLALAFAVVPATASRLGADRLTAFARQAASTTPPRRLPLVDDRLYLGILGLRRRLDEQEDQIAAERMIQARLLQALPDPLLQIDDQAVILYANEAAEQHFGKGAAGKPLARLVRDPRLGDATRRALSTRTAETVDLDEPRVRGRSFQVEVLPIAPRQQRSMCVLLFRERTSERQSQRMITDFVANASHEIRTPLTALRGIIETLRGPARNDEVARERFLATMAGETERMNRLVSELLVLSRVEMMQFDRPEIEVDFAAVLRTVEETTATLAKDQGVALSIDIPAGSLWVLADADQVQQVFVNLIDNALKYGGSGGRIEVAAERLATAPPNAGRLAGSPAIMATVRDYGGGIAADSIPRLTERFFRVDASRSRRLGGTGLGLAIVKHILNRHGGHLSIKSKPGEGATFSVFLPDLAKTRH